MGIVLIGLFFGELLVSLKVGLLIGFGWSAVWILASAVIGGLLIQFSPYALMYTFNTMSLSNFNPGNTQNVVLSYMFAAILLIIPGVVTDGFGVLMLVYTLYLLLFDTMRSNKKTTYNNQKGDDDVIDVKIIDESDSSKSDS